MADEQQKPEFAIQRIYVKDVSFESPNTPAIFRSEWQPKVNLEMGTQSEKVEADIYHLVLKITATVNQDDKTAFLIEVQQAGIFTIKNFAEKDLAHMLGAFCPNILFPYARELISECATRGGFPPLYLAPVNFDALYAEQLKKAKEQQAAAPEERAG